MTGYPQKPPRPRRLNTAHNHLTGGRNTHFSKRKFRSDSLVERLLILLVIAIVVGITIGIILPKISQPIGELTGEYSASGPAAEVLKQLQVDDKPSTAGYQRDLFGYRETDVDGNGCDVREDVLARDLTDVKYKAGTRCVVKSGVLQDPYTGKTIDFLRGPTTSEAVQIDHVVALQNAWQSGAKNWNKARLYAYGNDMYNLLAVDGKSNQAKGSSSAAYWLPTNSTYRCDYVARQIGVKDKYKLTVTSQEKRSMLAVLKNCPAQEIPKR